MISKRILVRNGVFSGLQFAINALGLLGSYRIISIHLGMAVLGAWAICLSIASLASLFDGGASDALVRQIAQAIAHGDRDAAAKLFSTAILMCVVGSATGALILYFSVSGPLSSFVATRIPGGYVDIFTASLWVGALNVPGNACIGVLEGLERYDLKLAVSSGGVLLFFVGILVLVPSLGARGMILAFVLQSGFVLAAAIPLIATRLPLLRNGNWKPDGLRALQLMRIGFPLKAFGLTSFALEPLTRMLMGNFGGMRSAGIYEIAARTVTQLRGLLVGVVQVALPRFVSLSVSDPQRSLGTEAVSVRITAATAILAFGSLTLLLPWVSRLLLNGFDAEFCQYALVLSFGWFLNTLCAPYFYATVAAAHLRSIWITMSLMAAINATAGYLLGMLFGPSGVVYGLSCAVAIGSIYVIRSRTRFQALSRLPYGRPELLLLLAAILILAANIYWQISNLQTVRVLNASAISALIFWAASICSSWFFYHDIRKKIIAI